MMQLVRVVVFVVVVVVHHDVVHQDCQGTSLKY